MPNEPVRFYFSFRSPYAWLAFHLIERTIADLPVELEYLPVFPPPDYPNDPTAVPNKLQYVSEHDVPRIASALGLPFQRPSDHDLEWMPSHAMWAYADEQGKGKEFGKAVYAARWSEGRDLGDEAVLRAAAELCGLDPDATIAAGGDKGYQTKVLAGMIRGVQEDGIFGVPLFVFRGERFWGHDRLPWLRRSIQLGTGASQVDSPAELLL